MSQKIDDLDFEDISDIENVNEIYTNLFDKILLRQKERGKKFISDAEIDSLINNIKDEEGIKKFNNFKDK